MSVRLFRSPATVVFILFLLGLSLSAWNIGRDAWLLFEPAGHYDPKRVLLVYSTFPRFMTALLVGAALALSGVMLQQSLRNPLASPTTLGTSAGANLSLVLSLLFFPSSQGFGRDTIAIAGAAVSACLVFAIGSRKGASPLSFILSGLMIGLWCSALSAVFVLMNDRYLSGLFIWGAGSLALQGWTVPFSLLPKIIACVVVAGLMVRPMSLMELGDAGALSVGLSVRKVRVLAIAVAVILSAFVTSAVGIIGFVGLVAPAIARLAGARRFAQQLVWSPLIGAGLLLVTDETVKLLSAAFGAFLPTGSMTALFGAPVVLMLLARLRTESRRPPNLGQGATRSWHVPRFMPALFLLTLAIGVVAAILIGRAPTGQWEILPFAEWQSILPYRWPRVVAALSAAMMLGASGVILQRLTGNEMASPELLGISAGATAGVALALFTVASAGFAVQLVFAAFGALAVLVMVLLLGLRSGFSPERVLLAGVVLTALLDALIGFLAAGGDPRAMMLIGWMSGSTSRVDQASALFALACAIVFAALVYPAGRWLTLLPLGREVSHAVGIKVPVARASLLVLSALMTAAATLIVGPLSFVGLVGPHIARELGLRGALSQMIGGAMAAGLLMLIADWLGRMIAFPYQMPAGLMAVLLGAPVLVSILMKNAENGQRRWLR
ncbi:iron complex transport system permease protein [Neorhizobium huautlense]|uniref:Iron complex transport system permease protein n=1 Tax=Neorhizobium huautlense TaxID=67774 RepID=A0ABT9Q1S4_9HYPH|nr:Fe(3+)-hydroxamate ABC transporter permease FhuB [Neorhizobium huautlense]MDP9840683.1 iron complex transport system permease protein [Neorhizobium huautlense]